jgi:hypothetical protein
MNSTNYETHYAIFLIVLSLLGPNNLLSILFSDTSKAKFHAYMKQKIKL